MTPDEVREAAARYAASQEDVEALAQAVLDRASWRARRGFKVCSSCHEKKKPADFGRDSTKGDGLETRCRSCRSV